MANYQNLRKANAARQEEWDRDDQVDFSWRCNELAGEAGEVCNILKKLHRERCGIRGSRATKDQLAEELADVMICVDLVAMTAGVPEHEVRNRNVDFTADALTDIGNMLAARVGAVSALTLERYADQRDLTAWRLHAVEAVVWAIANREGIDLHAAVANKFNLTSFKVGLSTTLRLENA